MSDKIALFANEELIALDDVASRYPKEAVSAYRSVKEPLMLSTVEELTYDAVALVVENDELIETDDVDEYDALVEVSDVVEYEADEALSAVDALLAYDALNELTA